MTWNPRSHREKWREITLHRLAYFTTERNRVEEQLAAHDLERPIEWNFRNMLMWNDKRDRLVRSLENTEANIDSAEDRLKRLDESL